MNPKNYCKCISFFFILLLFSCSQPRKKEYYYIETATRTQLQTTRPAETDPVLIRATSDSAAYVEAFSNFCLAEVFYEIEFQKSGAVASQPISFRLLNEDSVNILPTLSFANREYIEKAIKKRVRNYLLKKTTKK